MLNWDDPLAENTANGYIDRDAPAKPAQQAANEIDTPVPAKADISELPLTNAVTSVPLFAGFRGTALGRVDLSTPGTGPLRVSYEVMGSSSTSSNNHILKFKFNIERKGRPFP